MSGNTATNDHQLINASHNAFCQQAFLVVTLPFAQCTRILYLGLILATVFQFIRLVAEYRKKRQMAVHQNLKIFYINIVALYGVECLVKFLVESRNVFVSLVHDGHPCAMMTPFWYALVTRLCTYWDVMALHLLHLAVMVERLRATLLVNKYELEGRKFAIVTISGIYLLTTGFVCFFLSVVVSDLEVLDLNARLVANTLVTKHSNQVFVVFAYVMLGVIITVATGDWILYRTNRTMLENELHRQGKYHLSTMYQLNENIKAIRLILPLDIASVLTMSFTNIGALALRLFISELSFSTFLACYNWLNIVTTLYVMMALIYVRKYIVQHSVESRTRIMMAKVAPLKEAGEVYFMQLQSQWNR